MEITATKINVVDAGGRARIVLDGGGETGLAGISLRSTADKFLNILSQPDGSATISLDISDVSCGLTLGPAGLVIRDAAGLLGITIGDPDREGTLRVTVYQKGQPIWTSPPQSNGTNA